MLRPATISDDPGRNILPSMMRTCGRNAWPLSPTPRMMTLDGLSESRLGSVTSTTVSFDTRGKPSAPYATSGWLSTTPACARSTPLCTSVPAERRVTTTLSHDPV